MNVEHTDLFFKNEMQEFKKLCKFLHSAASFSEFVSFMSLKVFKKAVTFLRNSVGILESYKVQAKQAFVEKQCLCYIYTQLENQMSFLAH